MAPAPPRGQNPNQRTAAEEDCSARAETEVRLASHWATWLEVTKTCSGSGSQPSMLAVDALHPASSSARPSEAARDRTSTFSVTRAPGPVQRVRRFSPGDDEARLHDGLENSSTIHSWLCPRPLEVLPSKTSTSGFRRHSAPHVVSARRSILSKPASRRQSVALGGRDPCSRRVSFCDTPEVQDLTPSHQAEDVVQAPTKQRTQQMGVTPSDEAFAAFRVKNVLDQAEPLVPQGSLRAHVPKEPRYHAPGHHHHSVVAVRPAAIDAEMPPYSDPDGLAVLRTRLGEAQGQGMQSRVLRKAPHIKIRIRRAFNRGLVHHHHHLHHNGPVVISDAGQVAPPIVVHIRAPEILPATGASALPTPSPVEPPSTPLTSAALQRHEALMQQQPVDHSSTDAMAQAGIPASLSLGMSMHQGAIFGVVSTIAVEAMQITLAEKRGNAADQTASIASAAVRGAVVGAAGGGMALMLGPTAPTAIFVGYSLIREWLAQGYSWVHSEITGPVALNRAVEVSGSAAGGVAGAMTAATLLSGCGGVVVAAAAGCSGFAGSLGGREVAALCFQSLSSEKAPKRRTSRCSSGGSSTRRRNSRDHTSFEPELLEAYSLLGLDPRCTNTELKHAFRRAVALHSAEVLPGVLRAMELIRSTRQMPLLDVRNLDGGENLRICRRPLESLPLQSHSQLASFIGGMAAQPTTSVAF
ncbi:mok12 [Symbiodinium sp. CCMP2456]|nr:mok12 [Symbiodinium sp. CCMP2456]